LDQDRRALWDAVYIPSQEDDEETSRIMRDLPNSYGGTLEKLMKWRGFTSDESFANEIRYNTRTVWRMRKEEEYVTTLKTAVKVCVALQLPLILCIDVIIKSNASRKLTPNTVKLFNVLPAMCCLQLKLDELDEFLACKGLGNLDDDK